MNLTLVDPQSQVMITPSDLVEFLYCPRFIYFQNVLKIPQYEEKRYKVLKGRQAHENRERWNKQYLRKKIPVLRKETNVYLADPEIGLRGIVDEILYLSDGTIAPVDYKYTLFREKTFRTHKFQIIAYSILLESVYSLQVKRAYIAYSRGGSRTNEIIITDDNKQRVLQTIKQILLIIRNERLPQKTKYPVRCRDCTYKNICV